MDGTNQVGVQPDGGRRAALRPLFLLVLLGLLAFVLPQGGIEGAPVPGDESPADPESEVTQPTLLPVSDLIYRVPVSLRPSCLPLDNLGLPLEILSCSDDLTRVYFVRYADVAFMDEQFDQNIAPFALPERRGGCRAGVPSRENWYYSHAPNRPEGRMACYFLPPDVPATLVSQPEARLLSLVISNPLLGWSGHWEKWRTMVPLPPPEPAGPAEPSEPAPEAPVAADPPALPEPQTPAPDAADAPAEPGQPPGPQG